MVFMRSIKYRAFYKGEMRQVTALEWIHEGEDLAGCYLTGIDKCVIVNDDETTFGVDLLEFTGLHDRNGTEIYEGDIISFRNSTITGGFAKKNVGEVIKINGCFKAGYSWFHWFNCFDELIILGNKFENPELLEGE